MSHAPKNNLTQVVEPRETFYAHKWQPSAAIRMLRARALLYQNIRNFFATRQVLEVETPLLCSTSVTDPFITTITADVKGQDYYLQTSPEYAMKRLLAAGSGSIYQICKAFRQDEQGRLHNPEFTMLEWYHVGFDHHQLMDEMDDLLQAVLQTPKAQRLSYAALFKTYLGFDPHQATTNELKASARENGIKVASVIGDDEDAWLQLLLSHCIEPQLGKEAPCFIYDFPVTQAALARTRQADDAQTITASRFEVYYQGIELANGFHELQESNEQRQRFENNLRMRKQLNLPLLPIDEYLLAALSAGLPNCSGVALGIDRLLMLITKAANINDVLSFDFARV